MKKLTVLLFVMLLVGTISAGIGIGVILQDKELLKEDKDVLANAGITGYTISKIECGSESCIPIWVDKPNGDTIAIINLFPYSMSEDGSARIYYNVKELENMRDGEVDRIIRELIIIEKNKLLTQENDVGSNEVVVTITEKK